MQKSHKGAMENERELVLRSRQGHLEAFAAPTLEEYEGLLDHCHIQTDKADPGPAFHWGKGISDARKLLGSIHTGMVQHTRLGHMRKRF